MKVFNGIAVTDKVNLYNEKFTLQAMYSAYEEQYNELIPSYANHNHTKSIGHSKITGIYLEPKMAYTTNAILVCENEKEGEHTREYNFRYLYKKHVTDNIEKYNLLIEKMKDFIVGDHLKYWTNGVFIYNKGIVSRAIPKFVENIHDGLIDIKLLTPVLPGVYKVGEYLIFAHCYFRRGYSYLNTLNTPFLSKIECLDGESRSVKIAIDLDCIGLAETEHQEFEYQYWWGPKFNNDLNSIPLGVTVHENEHYSELLSEILKTEFGWYTQDNKHTFECEEITDIPNLRDGESNMYACRFVHSMIDKDSSIPVHLDGAIRAYSDEKMIERLGITIKDSNRDAIYTKIWRVDGNIPVERWKDLITQYYRDNMLVGEYFGGRDEKIEYRSAKQEQAAEPTLSLKKYIPCNIDSGDGIRINLFFSKFIEFNRTYDVYIRPSKYLTVNEKQFEYIESETFSFYKLLKREGLNVSFPNAKQVSFYDTVYNFPVFECISTGVADVIIRSIEILCRKCNENGDNRIVSFSIRIPYADKVGTYSFLGHVDDFVKYFNADFTHIPSNEKIYDWLSTSYEYISSNFTSAHDIHPFDILKSNGILSVPRCFVPFENIKSIDKNGEAILLLPQEAHDFIEQNHISAVIASIDDQRVCSKCSKDYDNCDCISFLDDGVCEIIQKATPIGLTWTNRSAFF